MSSALWNITNLTRELTWYVCCRYGFRSCASRQLLGAAVLQTLPRGTGRYEQRRFIVLRPQNHSKVTSQHSSGVSHIRVCCLTKCVLYISVYSCVIIICNVAVTS